MANLRPLAIAALLLAIAAVVVLLFTMLRGEGDVADQFGQPFVAQQVDLNGCPVEIVTQVTENQEIYVGYERGEVPAGAVVSARLYHEGQPVEESQPLTAGQDDTPCVAFRFARDGIAPGTYQADLLIDDRPMDQVVFTVVQGDPDQAVPVTGLDLGLAYAAGALDANNCPLERVAVFEAGQPVYVALEESTLPAGVELLARLAIGDEPVSESAPMMAEQNLQQCIVFQFEIDLNGQPLQPGQYEALILADGEPVDSVTFEIR
jgi:hypothetical protein